MHIPELMQSWPMTVDKLLVHASRWHGEREIVTAGAGGEIRRSSYLRVHERALRVSAALAADGIRNGERVATLAMNTERHLECWYGIMGIGAICHTLNPRLFATDLAYIVNHAEDVMILADAAFSGVLRDLLPQCPSVRKIVYLCTPEERPDGPGEDYESYIANNNPPVAWGGFREDVGAGLCYTSGTTGRPKGVLYSHRSNTLHTFMTLQADAFGLSSRDVVLAMVPMFHANAWGLAFSAPAVGAKLVMPGSKLDGASLQALIESEGVTFAAAVPTVWQALVDHLRATGSTFPTLRRAVVGGAACPRSLRDVLHDQYNVEVISAWGMTELSPVGTVSTPSAAQAAVSDAERVTQSLKQGRAIFGLDMEIFDESQSALPHDGLTSGRLKVRGAAAAARYYREEGDALDSHGWFDTGDVANIDPYGVMQITDRAKDLIKSGGEWISSLELENAACEHSAVRAAAVVGMPDPKWTERPVMLVQVLPGAALDVVELQSFLAARVARWWVPERIQIVAELPLGATGKFDKKLIRERLRTDPLAYTRRP